jgi:hypothetical protein
MAVRDLIPWNWGEKNVPIKREANQPAVLQGGVNNSPRCE